MLHQRVGGTRSDALRFALNAAAKEFTTKPPQKAA
jgi:hypothetical protein